MPSEERRDMVRKEDDKKDLSLPSVGGLDISNLPEEQQNELIARAGQTQIDLAKREVELRQDINAMGQSLGAITENVGKMTEQGVATTVTQHREDNLGTIEVVAGNTEAAKSGKMPRSVTGEINWMPVLVIVGIIAAIVIVALVAGR